jgi:hypothetical protein
MGPVRMENCLPMQGGPAPFAAAGTPELLEDFSHLFGNGSFGSNANHAQAHSIQETGLRS